MQNAFQNHNYYKEIIRSYLNIIVLKIASLNSSRTGQQLTLNPKVKDFRNLIERSNEEQKDLAFYAEQINVTKRKLSNICKKELGRPATSLLNEQLIMKSKRLLKHTFKTFSEIAYELIFTNPLYFVKFFKSNTSFTPGEYQNRIK